MTEQLTDRLPAPPAPVAGPEAAPPAAPPGPVRIAWAPVPKVDLLPREIVEARRFRRTQVVLGGALAASVLVGVLGTLLAGTEVGAAQQELDSAQSAVTSLQAQQARYAEVPKVTQQVEAATKARALAMGNDVLWYRFLNDLDGVIPTGLTLPNLTVAVTGSSADATAGNPLAPAGIGSFSASGTAATYQQVATLMDGLEKVNGLRSTNLTSASRQVATTGTGDVVNVTVNAVLSSEALSGRYDEKAQ